MAHRHEVRRDRDVGGVLAHGRRLGAVEREQAVGGEPPVVEHVGGVGDRRRQPRREHLLQVGVPLRPERGAPRVVERVEPAVALVQPAPERGRAPVAVARQVVAGVLVGDVPHRQGRVVGVAARHLAGQPHGPGGEDRRVRAPRLPAAGPAGAALDVDRQHLGVRVGEPRWRGRGGGGEVDGDAVLVQQVHRVVEPAELEDAVGGLDPAPGEDAEGDERDPGAGHEVDVLVPHLPGPLLGVVVAAVADAAAVDARHAHEPNLDRPRSTGGVSAAAGSSSACR